MLDHEIRIRIPNRGMSFIYTVAHDGVILETGTVEPLVDDEPFAPEYYGGSQAMD